MKVKGSLYWIYSFISGCKGKMLVAISQKENILALLLLKKKKLPKHQFMKYQKM